MVGLSLDNTVGAAYLGVCGSAVLFGITNLQTYIYFSRYPNDWALQRASVALLYILDAFHLSLTIAIVYYYLVTEFGNVAAQVNIVWTFKLQIAVNVVIIVYVQTLYAVRVWKLGRHFHRLLPYGVVLVVFSGYVVGVLLAVQTYKIQTFPALSTISWTVYLSFSTSTMIDFVIAGVMCWYLQRSRVKMEKFGGDSGGVSSGGMSRPTAGVGGRRGSGSGSGGSGSAAGRVIWKLMQYVIASGLATSACSMAALITYALLPNTLVFLGVEFLLTKLYINSFLAMLNARRSTARNAGFVTENAPTGTGVGFGFAGGVSTEQGRSFGMYRDGGEVRFESGGGGGGGRIDGGLSPGVGTTSVGSTVSPFRVHVRTSMRTHTSSIPDEVHQRGSFDVGDSIAYGVGFGDYGDSGGGDASGGGVGGGRREFDKDVWVDDDSKSSMYDIEKDGIPLSPLRTLPHH